MSDHDAASASTEHPDRLTNLYAAHVRDELGDRDRRWLEVHTLLEKLIRKVIREHPNRLFGGTFDSYVTQVHTEIIKKFLWKRFGHSEPTIQPLLRQAILREYISAGRRNRSATGMNLDSADKVPQLVAPPTPGPHHGDAFGRLRAELCDTRFPEVPLVREMLLAVLLAEGAYPGAWVTRLCRVRPGLENVVYNAAVVDVNRAVMSVLPEGRRALCTSI